MRLFCWMSAQVPALSSLSKIKNVYRPVQHRLLTFSIYTPGELSSQFQRHVSTDVMTHWGPEPKTCGDAEYGCHSSLFSAHSSNKCSHFFPTFYCCLSDFLTFSPDHLRSLSHILSCIMESSWRCREHMPQTQRFLIHRGNIWGPYVYITHLSTLVKGRDLNTEEAFRGIIDGGTRWMRPVSWSWSVSLSQNQQMCYNQNNQLSVKNKQADTSCATKSRMFLFVCSRNTRPKLFFCFPFSSWADMESLWRYRRTQIHPRERKIVGTGHVYPQVL